MEQKIIAERKNIKRIHFISANGCEFYIHGIKIENITFDDQIVDFELLYSQAFANEINKLWMEDKYILLLIINNIDSKRDKSYYNTQKKSLDGSRADIMTINGNNASSATYVIDYEN